MICRKCGKENNDSLVFCAYCGERLIDEGVGSSEDTVVLVSPQQQVPPQQPYQPVAPQQPYQPAPPQQPYQPAPPQQPYQPAAPQQPYQPAPPQQPKKSKKGLIIGIIVASVVVTIIAVVGVIIAITSGSDSDNEVVTIPDVITDDQGETDTDTDYDYYDGDYDYYDGDSYFSDSITGFISDGAYYNIGLGFEIEPKGDYTILSKQEMIDVYGDSVQYDGENDLIYMDFSGSKCYIEAMFVNSNGDNVQIIVADKSASNSYSSSDAFLDEFMQGVAPNVSGGETGTDYFLSNSYNYKEIEEDGLKFCGACADYNGVLVCILATSNDSDATFTSVMNSLCYGL